jgi:predicted transposase YdaD
VGVPTVEGLEATVVLPQLGLSLPMPAFSSWSNACCKGWRLAVLRNLSTTIFKSARNMALNIDIREDALYQLGQEKGQEEGKEKAALNMLKDGFPPETVARLTELPTERVAQLKLELDASGKAS